MDLSCPCSLAVNEVHDKLIVRRIDDFAHEAKRLEVQKQMQQPFTLVYHPPIPNCCIHLIPEMPELALDVEDPALQGSFCTSACTLEMSDCVRTNK